LCAIGINIMRLIHCLIHHCYLIYGYTFRWVFLSIHIEWATDNDCYTHLSLEGHISLASLCGHQSRSPERHTPKRSVGAPFVSTCVRVNRYLHPLMRAAPGQTPARQMRPRWSVTIGKRQVRHIAYISRWTLRLHTSLQGFQTRGMSFSTKVRHINDNYYLY